MTPIDTTVTDHMIDAPGGKLFAREWTTEGDPSRAPIILLHDSLGSVEVWRDFPALLAAATRRRVIAYDRLGFGRSDPRADRLTSRFVSEEAQIFLPCLLRQLQIDQFIPFGHSVGGGMAVYCGATLADSCAAIVTESAQIFVEDITLQAIAAAKVQYANSERLEKLRKYHGAKAQWVLHAWIDTWLSPEFASWNVCSVLPQIRCPLLAIHGDQDEFGSLKHPELARTLSGGEVETRVLEGCGHVPHKERPDTIVESVAQFLG